MKIQKLAAPVGVAAVAIGMAGATVAPASAANNIKPFGIQETLNDSVTQAPMIGYTVTSLRPSTAAVPHNGDLYEAAVTVEGLGGWATPLTALFNARAENGQNYRIIGGGVPPAPPGGKTTGVLFFDVVGEAPNSVVYNDGVQDLLVWVEGPTEAAIAGTAPPGETGTSEIIGGTELGGAESGGADASAPAVAPPSDGLTPLEIENNQPSHEAARGGR